ncbi:MAG: bifunctional DNA primase/polymerase, partial [Candidatus Hodarchaeota archaeon]
KKPFIPWIEFQERKATAEEIQEWWKKWPSANVGIVTGKISGIAVVDIDESRGFDAIQEYVPDSLIIPTSKTPRGGQHFYFQAPEQGLGNNSRLVPGCDFRGDGGYVIAPPSTNGKGKSYAWLDGLSIEEADPPPLPSKLFNIFNACTYKEKVDEKVDEIEKNQYFQQGRRDEDLFHVANCLLKGYCGLLLSTRVLEILAANCKPPFDPKEADIKVKSALARVQRRERNISDEIREFVMSTSGLFTSTDVYKCLLLSTRQEQKLTWKVLNRMVEEGLIEKASNRNGCYRRLEQECENIDFLNASSYTVDLSLPFEIEKKAEIMPGNIIVIAGEMNAGKTAFLLNVIRDNMERFDVHYFSSEMGAAELKKRLSKFDYPIDLNQWKFTAKERSDNFSDVIISGEGKINIIDYLELHTNFYEVSKHLAEIHKKLKGAIAIVAIQKNPGTDVGLGGFRGLEKPRLYLAMGSGRLKIVKAKNWASQNNPNGQQVKFKVVDGCKLIKVSDWHLASSE